VIVRALLSVVIAAGVAAILVSRLSRRLDVHTDIVGYPVYSNFDINRYFWVYAIWAVVFPLLAVGIDVALAQLTRNRLPQATWPVRSDEPPTSPNWSVPATELVRVSFVGLVFGIGAALLVDVEGKRFLLVLILVLALYVAGTFVAAGRIGDGLTVWEGVAAVNLFAAPFTVLTLFALSQETEMRVLASGRVYEYRWFPWWFAVPVAIVLFAAVAWAASRATNAEHVWTLERRAVLLIAAPVLLWVVVAKLPGEIGVIDFFHEGEFMAATNLTVHGSVPWRDVIFVHGLLSDFVAPLIGFESFENTRWGYYAGALMMVAPVYFISQYFLLAYLFRRNVLFLLGTQVAVVLGVIHDVHFRFVLMPVALLLLAAVLRTATWPRVAALAGVLLVQAVLSPETAVAIPAVLITLALYELSWYRRERAFLVNFRRTARVVACGALGLALLCAVFAAFGILDDFVFFYRTFLSGHALTGGIPLQWWNTRYRVEAIAPVVIVVLAIWFFATAWRARWSPAIDDWVMGALAITVLLYYPKFLARTDVFHVFHPFAVAVPLLAYAAYRLLSVFEGRRIRLGTSRVAVVSVLTALAIVVVAIAAPERIVDRAEALPGQGSAQAHYDPVAPRLSFLSPLAIDVGVILDVKRVLDTYLRPDDDVFDFTNEPLLFHYLLERRPIPRYFDVSMAIRRHTQADLIRKLERRRPPLVVFSSRELVFGLPVWDQVSNQVRHYDVSEYILDHYRPLLSVHDFLFMARNDSGFVLRPSLARQLKARPATDGLYFRTPPCDWGYAPNFLTTGPGEAERARAVDVLPRQARQTAATGPRSWELELPNGTSTADYDWIELETAGELSADTLGVSDARGDALHTITFKTLPSGRRSVRVQVGACPQWHGFRDRIYLESASGQEIERVRLVP
jgi:hypothetical protein